MGERTNCLPLQSILSSTCPKLNRKICLSYNFFHFSKWNRHNGMGLPDIFFLSYSISNPTGSSIFSFYSVYLKLFVMVFVSSATHSHLSLIIVLCVHWFDSTHHPINHFYIIRKLIFQRYDSHAWAKLNSFFVEFKPNFLLWYTHF